MFELLRLRSNLFRTRADRLAGFMIVLINQHNILQQNRIKKGGIILVWTWTWTELSWTWTELLVPFYKNNGFSLVTCCFENFLVHFCLLYLIALQINWWKLRSWVHQLENIPRSRFLSIDLVSTCNELSLD